METTPKTIKFKSVYSTPSPRDSREEKPKQQLSASLKERLKRSRRAFTSPVSVAKRLCVDEGEECQRQVSGHASPTDGQNVDINRNEVRSETERVPGPLPESTQPTPMDLLQLRDQLKREVKERTETLRRLKMVKMYRIKNDLTQLQNLTDKWRSCVQAALFELQTDLPIDGGKASLSHLIDLFGLDDGILHFDRAEDDFVTT